VKLLMVGAVWKLGGNDRVLTSLMSMLCPDAIPLDEDDAKSGISAFSKGDEPVVIALPEPEPVVEAPSRVDESTQWTLEDVSGLLAALR
jgi:hypothetical protein